MFTIIYRWKLKTGQEEAFRDSWAEATRIIKAQCGSYGSSLFHEADNIWCAIACWPSSDERDDCTRKDPVPQQVWEKMRACVEERLPARELTLDTYLWSGEIRENSEASR